MTGPDPAAMCRDRRPVIVADSAAAVLANLRRSGVLEIQIAAKTHEIQLLRRAARRGGTAMLTKNDSNHSKSSLQIPKGMAANVSQ